MSRIYFHSPSAEVEVRGSERAHAGLTTTNFFLMVLGVADWLQPRDEEAWRAMLPDDASYIKTSKDQRFSSSLKSWLAVGDGPLIVAGEKLELFSLQLNTAMRWGNDAVKLLARLHGQCELHAYVEGPNRKWLAHIIERGRTQRVLRHDQGWEGLIEMLRKRDDEPVVTSYSVCDQFPSTSVLPDFPHGDDAASETWWGQPSEVRWEACLKVIRTSHDGARQVGLEMKPETWENYFFGHGKDASDVLDVIYDRGWKQRQEGQ